jgi:hypothetical protein
VSICAYICIYKCCMRAYNQRYQALMSSLRESRGWDYVLAFVAFSVHRLRAMDRSRPKIEAESGAVTMWQLTADAHRRIVFTAEIWLILLPLFSSHHQIPIWRASLPKFRTHSLMRLAVLSSVTSDRALSSTRRPSLRPRLLADFSGERAVPR